MRYLAINTNFWSGNPGDYIRMATLPNEFRPNADLRQLAFVKDGAIEYMYVGADGAIGFTNVGTAGAEAGFIVSCAITYTAG